MRKIRLNIGDEKGNAFYILGTVNTLGRQMDMDAEEIKNIQDQMKGTVMQKLGGTGNNYEGLLRAYLDAFPFVELYATFDIGIDRSLYTLDSEPEIYEL